jgi:putative transposase
MDGYPKAKKVYLNKLNRIKDYELIKAFHDELNYDISFSCEVLHITRSSYYKWLNSKPTNKQIEDEEITSKIKEIAASNNSLFGAMNMYYTLRNQGYKCGHNRVYRLMCINDIKSTYRRKGKYHYTRSTAEAVAENTLKREFNAEAPNQKWCTDVTEIKVPFTGEKLFISPMIDLYDRFPVALEVSERNDADLANSTLDNAHEKYPSATPLVHSDRGFAYTRVVWHNKLEEYGMRQSMSRVSRCIDNGVCEGFQGQFKDILFILYPNIKTKEEMIEAIYGTLDYYINHYPQKRFNGKTCGQIRAEAMAALENNETINAYPIKQANRYINFWKDIELKKQRALQQI